MQEEMEKNVGEVPEAEAKAEGQKLEWGPELGPISFNDAEKELEKLNSALPEGEPKWRFPTDEECIEKLKAEGLNFKARPHWVSYYSNISTTDPSRYALTVNIFPVAIGGYSGVKKSGGNVVVIDREDPKCVCFVRNIA